MTICDDFYFYVLLDCYAGVGLLDIMGVARVLCIPLFEFDYDENASVPAGITEFLVGKNVPCISIGLVTSILVSTTVGETLRDTF